MARLRSRLNAAEAQLSGATLDGLGAALHGRLTAVDGVVQESNFNRYQVLRMSEAPIVEVILIDGDAPQIRVGQRAGYFDIP